jgi:hypothetical protein
MKIILFVLFYISVAVNLKAQIKALTENGREVLLSENGTWKYANDSATDSSANIRELSINPHPFTKSAGASFLVKSNNLNIGVFINTSKWTFTAHKDNEPDIEYHFGLKTNDGFGIMITEKTEIDLDNMRQIALANAQKAAVDAKVVSAEYRMVNNIKVLCLEIKGTIKSIRFVYFGYYFSNENGTVQLLCYSTQKLFEQLHGEFENLLNGMVVLNK